MADNFLLVQELLSDIKKPNRGGNVMLKLDMMKANDRVSWIFLTQVLRRFGFSEVWIDMVWRISNVWFSVIVNGLPQGFFRSTRGLRQGDPISPTLFVIRAEVLSRSLNALAGHRSFRPFKVPSSCPLVTHLAYADDVVILMSGFKASVKLVKGVVNRYCEMLGQKFNCQKSCLLVHPTLPLQRRRHRILSTEGKVVLLRSVLSSIPIYLLAAASLPRRVFALLEKVMADFLWGSTDLGPKFHWISWGDLCRSKEEGGIGVRSMAKVYDAFSIKLWWNFRQKHYLWVEFLTAIYNKGLHLCLDEGVPSQSSMWRRLCSVEIFHENIVSDFVTQAQWNLGLLNQVLQPGLVRQVIEVPPPSPRGSDRMVWALTQDGVFFGSPCGPTRCHCCTEPGEEGINHTFCTGKVAKAVWSSFEDPGEASRVSTLRHRVIWWWLRQGQNVYLKFVYRLLPMIPYWEMWKARNRGVFEGRRLVGTEVRNLGISGDGGVVRDLEGQLIFSYSYFFGSLTSLHAELKAMACGVQLCVARSLHDLHIKVDSLVLVQILQGKDACPWRLQREVDGLLRYKRYFGDITHCYREANKPTDYLANLGADTEQEMIFGSHRALPGMVRGEIQMERLDFPNFRKRSMS
nr:uncharacterized protein LOC113696849 [Coffea arabica]